MAADTYVKVFLDNKPADSPYLAHDVSFAQSDDDADEADMMVGFDSVKMKTKNSLRMALKQVMTLIEGSNRLTD